ncbi:MAG TPA: hypothetical protein VD995_32105 [Azospirillum sp.]|nr:hypothetical protein [Azospirillum sp.]
MSEPEDREIVVEECRNLIKAAGHLRYSYEGVLERLPADRQQFAAMPSGDLERLDALAIRFGRCQDMAASTLRSIATYQDLAVDSFPRLLDDLRRHGLRIEPEDWSRMRKLRNTVVHDYPKHEDELVNAYEDLIKLTPALLSAVEQIRAYVAGPLDVDPTDRVP